MGLREFNCTMNISMSSFTWYETKGVHIHVYLCVSVAICIYYPPPKSLRHHFGSGVPKPFRVYCGNRDLVYFSADQLNLPVPRSRVDRVVFAPFLIGVATEE